MESYMHKEREQWHEKKSKHGKRSWKLKKKSKQKLGYIVKPQTSTVEKQSSILKHILEILQKYKYNKNTEYANRRKEYWGRHKRCIYPVGKVSFNSLPNIKVKWERLNQKLWRSQESSDSQE